MDERTYGMIITGILRKLSLGLPLTAEECMLAYEFIMSQNNALTDAYNIIAQQDGQAKAYRRLLALNKAKLRK